MSNTRDLSVWERPDGYYWILLKPRDTVRKKRGAWLPKRAEPHIAYWSERRLSWWIVREAFDFRDADAVVLSHRIPDFEEPPQP